MTLLKPERKYKANNHFVTIIKLLGKGKSGYSYLVSENGKQFVLKLMHDEECSYYNFKNGKVELELDAYKSLSGIDIPIPKLIDHNIEKQFILKEYIGGDLASEYISKEQISDILLKQLFEMSNRLVKEGLNIDYFPNNFVIKDDKLIYIDYEVNQYSVQWDLNNWGIFYWLNTEGFKKFLETGDANFINSDLGKGVPIKEPFLDKVSKLIELYSLK